MSQFTSGTAGGVLSQRLSVRSSHSETLSQRLSVRSSHSEEFWLRTLGRRKRSRRARRSTGQINRLERTTQQTTQRADWMHQKAKMRNLSFSPATAGLTLLIKFNGSFRFLSFLSLSLDDSYSSLINMIPAKKEPQKLGNVRNFGGGNTLVEHHSWALWVPRICYNFRFKHFDTLIHIPY